ncbi:hypothetical protein ACIGFK_15665 [Streptomyces sp. NPDC085524]|uniref:PspA-associated protein PspAB n=1 Tax=Streptomyces sp. NPDC085524 TaxID=3365728 RepID=UPI0037D77BA6
MGLLDAILGRSKPVLPGLDRLFGLPSAAITLQAGAGSAPTGVGSVCFASVEGGTFYPFAPLPAQTGTTGETCKRDNAAELQIRALLADDLPIEPDLGRWFPVWGAPGLG